LKFDTFVFSNVILKLSRESIKTKVLLLKRLINPFSITELKIEIGNDSSEGHSLLICYSSYQLVVLVSKKQNPLQLVCGKSGYNKEF
jgi:hypothetical protein